MDDVLVTIATCEKIEKVYFLKSKLESENIRCYLENEIFSKSANPDTPKGVALQVKAKDVEKFF